MTGLFKSLEALLVTMVRPTFLVLHRTEWERLKQQCGPPQEAPEDIKKDYLKSLTEKSQQWRKTWPDTAACRVALIEKQKKQQLKDNIAYIKAYAKKSKQNNTAGAIQEAKQLIFENSNYGRKLLSALLESRAMEVRKKQINFRQEIQRKEDDVTKDIEKSENNAIMKLDDKDAERIKLEKLTALECNRVNKEMASLKHETELQIKLNEKQCAIEDENLREHVLANEQKERDDIKHRKKQGIEKYEAERKAIKNIKAKEKEIDDALTEIHRKGQDRVKYKMHAVVRKLHLDKPDTKWTKDLYKHVDQIHKEEEKRYDYFINTGITKLEERTSEKDKKEKQREKEKGSSRYLMSQRNKIAGEEVRLAKISANKCDCDRQSLILNTNRKLLNKIAVNTDGNHNHIEMKSKNTEIRTVGQSKSTANESDKTTAYNDKYGEKKEVKLLFLAPRNKLMEELKKRETEPSPWNAAKAAHAHFAQQADHVLKEITHKHLARKVVDEYRKFNCLDETTLPVPNY